MKSTNLFTLVIGLLLGAGGVYLLSNNDQKSVADGGNYLTPDDKMTLSSPDFDDELIELFSNQNKSVSQDAGAFIKASEAETKLEDFISNRRWRRLGMYNRKKDVYGYFFGLKMVDSLINMVKRHNDTISTDEMKIVGIRAYQGRSETNGKKHTDIFLMPVRTGGHNFYPIGDLIDQEESDNPANDSFTGDDAILNTSVPCPNKCD